MIITIHMTSEVPIYVQLRNQIVLGIGRGELKEGEALPTIRQLAEDAGINLMTVNKAYQILKNEGFIEIDRRHGAKVAPQEVKQGEFREKLASELELLTAESKIKGIGKEEFLRLCAEFFDRKPEADDTENKGNGGSFEETPERLLREGEGELCF
ncbi:MAG: GntR family transcriptional regulator [Lachnospiraceae bacterium]|nr:GntR family transcriptional regulator [Lachnospiraceae bacterium]